MSKNNRLKQGLVMSPLVMEMLPERYLECCVVLDLPVELFTRELQKCERGRSHAGGSFVKEKQEKVLSGSVTRQNVKMQVERTKLRSEERPSGPARQGLPSLLCGVSALTFISPTFSSTPTFLKSHYFDKNNFILSYELTFLILDGMKSIFG